MDVLLLRPAPRNERFGLGPFFRTEPLGLEYVAAALEARGHRASIVDLRFGWTVERAIARFRPAIVGVACLHSLEIDDTLEVARRVRRAAPGVFILLGGHSASAFPGPLRQGFVDAISVADGERVVADLADVLSRGGSPSEVAGMLVNDGRGEFVATPAAEPVDLDEIPLPARHALVTGHGRYACVQFRPTWLVETARGCPFRCSFCSVWPLYERSYRLRSVDAVCRDLATVGPHVFVADDLFWHRGDRSRELAEELRRRNVRKRWVLVQTRTDLVAAHPELLEAWRPFAESIDIFFGLEAATNDNLDGLAKDTTVACTIDAIAVAREHGYGVTGNFVIDPEWDENDFQRLWAFVDEHKLHRAGYTILTPLPGTPYYEGVRKRIRATNWSQFDMSHLLWEPKLGGTRFFQLYCETWRRSVLNLKGNSRWWRWFRDVKPQHIPFLVRALWRTQRMMDPQYYLAEHRLSANPSEPPAECPALANQS
jgi:hopanoid C-3 methylase